MSQAIYNFPPEIETSPLPKCLEEKLTISIWQVEDKYEIIWITGHWSRVRGNRVANYLGCFQTPDKVPLKSILLEP